MGGKTFEEEMMEAVADKLWRNPRKDTNRHEGW